jgi:hypothetical protein
MNSAAVEATARPNTCARSGVTQEINAAAGKATMLYLPRVGLKGYSHLLMMERNNLTIADLILDWIAKN